MALHISISAETLFYIGPIPVTNSMLTSMIVSLILILTALKFHRSQKSLERPKGLQNFLEMIVDAFQNLGNSITQNELKTSMIMPIPIAAFMWILLNNWFGLIPGVGVIGINQPTESPHTFFSAKTVYASETEASSETEPKTYKFVPLFRPGTADLNTTLALALISMTSVQFIGVKFLGKSYWSKFFNLKGVFAFVGILELVSDISKVISFAFRLFGNIFAGEVLLTVISFLALMMFKVVLPVIIPMPFYFLELFVGLIQALVFAMLTIVFMNMATIHGEAEH